MLIVDDEKEVRDGLRFLLEGKGYKVVDASDGPEVIVLAVQQPIDGRRRDRQRNPSHRDLIYYRITTG